MINAIILISVVLIGSFSYYYFSVKPRLLSLNQETTNKSEQESKSEKKERMEKDEIVAAMALALHLNSEQLNDEEKTVLTLKTVAKLYSPWSSKIYGLTKNPR
jgi:glutaconyl-CoA/methylmalonyl-CoA decarboxylase subunit delta